MDAEFWSRKYPFIPYTKGLMVCGFSPGVLGVFASTVNAGPTAVAGGDKVTVTLLLTVGVCVLVAVTVTDAGAG